MSETPITKFKAKAMLALGLRKKSTLQAPATTKRVLRWAIRKRVKWAYVVFLSWPFVLAVILAASLFFVAQEKEGVPLWMTRVNIGMAVLLASMKMISRWHDLDFAWKRRRR